MLGRVVLALLTLAPAVALAQPAVQLTPTNDGLMSSNLLQVFPSGCPIKEPAEGALMRYFSAGVGTYTAYGDRSLLPVGVIATHEGYPGNSMDKLAFGSRTKILMPAGEVLNGHPYPAVPLMVDPPQLVDVGFLGSNSGSNPGETFNYTFPLITPFWEIAGTRTPSEPQKRVCLYLEEVAR